MTGGEAFTLKEILLEVRDRVTALDEKIDRIDRQGSIGTREELRDHEQRLRMVESWHSRLKGSLAVVSVAVAGITAFLVSHFA